MWDGLNLLWLIHKVWLSYCSDVVEIPSSFRIDFALFQNEFAVLKWEKFKYKLWKKLDWSYFLRTMCFLPFIFLLIWSNCSFTSFFMVPIVFKMLVVIVLIIPFLFIVKNVLFALLFDFFHISFLYHRLCTVEYENQC